MFRPLVLADQTPDVTLLSLE